MSNIEKYRVNDSIIEATSVKLALLLESPYKEEVKHGAPIAGKSGLSVTRHFTRYIHAFSDWDSRTPFGIQHRARKSSQIAIINCSNLPLDMKTYGPELDPRELRLVEVFDRIRRGFKTAKWGDPERLPELKTIIDDLDHRLTRLPATTLVTLCGDFAEHMFNLCPKASATFKTIKTPHPSFNLWARPVNKKAMDDFYAVANHLFGDHIMGASKSETV